MALSEDPAKLSLRGSSAVATNPTRAPALMDPYSLPRNGSTLQTMSNRGQQSDAPIPNPPAPDKLPRSSTQISDASHQTARPRRRTLHPELKSLISLSIARESLLGIINAMDLREHSAY